MTHAVPALRWNTPSLNHAKLAPYIDYPVVYEATKTNEPFYVQSEWTFVTSDKANTQLFKWNGIGWTEVLGWDNPEHFYGRGYFSVTTAANCTVVVSEHHDLPDTNDHPAHVT